MRIERVERWAWAEVDHDALAHNVSVVRRHAAPAAVWAVVKADAYGHGAVEASATALAAGAEGLCVALVQEGAALRTAGVDAPILVLSEQPSTQATEMVRHGLTPTVSTAAGIDAIASAAADTGAEGVAVHLKVDTGMQRVGAAPADVVALARRIVASRLRCEGVFTHLACADEPASPATAQQLAAFEGVLDDLARAGLLPALTHAANSAGALAHPSARRSFVRAGIALYGISPGPGVDHLCGELRPVLSLHARVSFVKRVRAGSHVSYGWRHRFERDTNVATLPIGYADGVPRRLGTLPDRPGAEVLIAGERHPIVGVVTMDQLLVDVGDAAIAVGDEAVLLGAQGDERITAEDWADRLGTIGYEVVCGIGARVPRVVRRAPRGS